MLKLIYYVPETHLEITKKAIFEAGAGGMGDYQSCAWQVKGIGQFKPVANANPFLGTVGKLETIEEWRVETILEQQQARLVLDALKSNHPYEEVPYEFIQLIDIE